MLQYQALSYDNSLRGGDFIAYWNVEFLVLVSVNDFDYRGVIGLNFII